MSSEFARLPYGVIYDQRAPIISVDLFYDYAHVLTLAYVDSGASYSVFKSDIAERLGLDWSRGTRVWGFAADGKRIPIYLQRVGLRIAEFQFSGTLGFSDEMKIGFISWAATRSSAFSNFASMIATAN